MHHYVIIQLHTINIQVILIITYLKPPQKNSKQKDHYNKDTYLKKRRRRKLVSQRSKMKIFIQITVGIVYQGDRRLPWLG